MYKITVTFYVSVSPPFLKTVSFKLTISYLVIFSLIIFMSFWQWFLNLRKARSHRMLNLDCWLGWFIFYQKYEASTCLVTVNATVTWYTNSLTCDSLQTERLESFCLFMCNKVFFDWLSSYNKAAQLALNIFKITGYFPSRPHMQFHILYTVYLQFILLSKPFYMTLT